MPRPATPARTDRFRRTLLSRAIVIDAGSAGLAADALHRAGIDGTVLEARGGVGGRVLTERPPILPLPGELGASACGRRTAQEPVRAGRGRAA